MELKTQQSSHQLSPSQLSPINFLSNEQQANRIIENHQIQISLQDHQNFAVHDQKFNKGIKKSVESNIILQSSLKKNNQKKIGIDFDLKMGLSQAQQQIILKNSISKFEQLHSNSGDKLPSIKSSGLEMTLSKIKFQKEFQGKTSPFKITDIERNKSMQPFKSQTRLYAQSTQRSANQSNQNLQKVQESKVSIEEQVKQDESIDKQIVLAKTQDEKLKITRTKFQQY